MKYALSFTYVLLSILIQAQENNPLPYREIPKAPEHYSAGTVVSRMVDGLGFRYYWATEGLRPDDLDFKPGPESRTSFETLDHIHDLSRIIVNSVTATTNTPGVTKPAMTFDEMRKATLENLSRASEILRKSSDEDFAKFELTFQRDNNSRTFPFWNQLNGPIADALWHVGQVVSFRRQSGNPFSEKVSVFNGTVSK
ncbi:MAG TPA: hypothetical protein VD927_04510 [Chryseosolibacter sp.]|nr:hypothetical protein [Chryseosolibacter sp.]